MKIKDIIAQCGGSGEIARASQKCARPITYRAVLKWKVNGIPSHWFSLVESLSGVSREEIGNANAQLPRYQQYEIKKEGEQAAA